ncbi:hypothetical protein [Pseudoalteromonas xiamenensis]
MSEQIKLETFFIDFFTQRGVVLPECWQEFNFIAAGVLDSFELLTLIMALENEVGLHIPADVIADPKNATLGMLANSIAELG